MPRFSFEIMCANCSKKWKGEVIGLTEPDSAKAFCPECYFPLRYYPKEGKTEIRMEPITKRAFLIHSSKPEEKSLLDWLRSLLKLYGIATTIIEEDPRSVDWLQKSLEGITSADFVLVFLTKRYQFVDESGNVAGWKAPDKCYDEIAISFALRKDLFALVEREVEPGNVLRTRAWCYRFEEDSPIKVDYDFFEKIEEYLRGK
jgi:hypothetical protein